MERPATTVSASTLSPPELVRIAYAHARHLGLPREDAQDCAMEFQLHLLRCPTPHLDNPAWIHRCARNYACNFLRALIRRQQRERCESEQTHRTGQYLSSRALGGPGPKTLTLRKALWEQVMATLRHFTPEQRDLFVCYHLRQQSLAELAERTGRTVHALQQALYNMHRRLARLLQQEGWSASDAEQLFSASLPAAASRLRP